MCASIRIPFTFICNLSLRTGIFPDAMKIAKIQPLHKGGDKTTCENFRPISLLPVFSKVLEKVVFYKVVEHLESNQILYTRQYGFRKNHSTNDAVVDLVNEILKGNENGNDILAVFIDLKKAFDTCTFDNIIRKLCKYGIDGHLLDWFENYFRGRKQYTVVNGHSSCLKEILIGVPQGSLLGVLCFQIIINDLYKCLKWSSSILYADDTTIFLKGKNLKFLVTKLNADLQHLKLWLEANQLCLNVKKTKFMLFSLKPYEGDINLYIGTDKLEMVDDFQIPWFHHGL